MNEQDNNSNLELIPFDWGKYKAGDGVYYIHAGDYGWITMDNPLIKIETKRGSVVYECSNDGQYDESELRLPKQQVNGE